MGGGSRADVAELRTAIRSRALRATPARIAVLRLLRRSQVALSHDDVVRRLGQHIYDRATLYRSLNQLAGSGLVRRIDLGDRTWRFLSIDDAGEPGRALHADFICNACGTVERVADLQITAPHPDAPKAIASRQVEVRMYGTCDDCR